MGGISLVMNENERIAEMLSHDAELLRVAFSVLRDHDRARDAVQDAYIAGYQQRERLHADSRAWLCAVTRNFARMRIRSEQRRSSRERAAAVSESTANTTGRLETEEQTRALMCEVRNLDEPARTALLLRFEKGLSYASIGRALDIRPATARSRVHRALSALRQRAKRIGASVAVAVASLGRRPLLACIGLLGAASVTGLAVHLNKKAPHHQRAQVTASRTPRDNVAPLAGTETTEDHVRDPHSTHTTPKSSLRGRVTNEANDGVWGVTVLLVQGDRELAKTFTDFEGYYEFKIDCPEPVLVVARPATETHLASVSHALSSIQGEQVRDLQVPSSPYIAGILIDAAGKPVRGFRMSFYEGETSRNSQSARTGRTGEFRFRTNSDSGRVVCLHRFWEIAGNRNITTVRRRYRVRRSPFQLAIRVLDMESGKLIAAKVELFFRGTRFHVSKSQTTAKIRFPETATPADSFETRATATGYEVGTWVFPAASLGFGPTLLLDPTPNFQVEIRESDGALLDDTALVVARFHDSTGMRQIRLKNGSARIPETVRRVTLFVFSAGAAAQHSGPYRFNRRWDNVAIDPRVVLAVDVAREPEATIQVKLPERNVIEIQQTGPKIYVSFTPHFGEKRNPIWRATTGRVTHVHDLRPGRYVVRARGLPQTHDIVVGEGTPVVVFSGTPAPDAAKTAAERPARVIPLGLHK